MPLALPEVEHFEGGLHVREFEIGGASGESPARERFRHEPLALGDEAGKPSSMLAHVVWIGIAEDHPLILRFPKEFDGFEPGHEVFNQRVAPAQEVAHVLIDDQTDDSPAGRFQHFRHGQKMPQSGVKCQTFR